MKRQEAEQAAREKKKSDREAQEATMEAVEEENRRIASSCKTKCTANAVSKAVSEINKTTSEVAEYCANSFPCAGELEKVRAATGEVKKQANDLQDGAGATTTADAEAAQAEAGKKDAAKK